MSMTGFPLRLEVALPAANVVGLMSAVQLRLVSECAERLEDVSVVMHCSGLRDKLEWRLPESLGPREIVTSEVLLVEPRNKGEPKVQFEVTAQHQGTLKDATGRGLTRESNLLQIVEGPGVARDIGSVIAEVRTLLVEMRHFLPAHISTAKDLGEWLITQPLDFSPIGLREEKGFTVRPNAPPPQPRTTQTAQPSPKATTTPHLPGGRGPGLTSIVPTRRKPRDTAQPGPPVERVGHPRKEKLREPVQATRPVSDRPPPSISQPPRALEPPTHQYPDTPAPLEPAVERKAKTPLILLALAGAVILIVVVALFEHSRPAEDTADKSPKEPTVTWPKVPARDPHEPKSFEPKSAPPAPSPPLVAQGEPVAFPPAAKKSDPPSVRTTPATGAPNVAASTPAPAPAAPIAVPAPAPAPSPAAPMAVPKPATIEPARPVLPEPEVLRRRIVYALARDLTVSSYLDQAPAVLAYSDLTKVRQLQEIAKTRGAPPADEHSAISFVRLYLAAPHLATLFCEDAIEVLGKEWHTTHDKLAAFELERQSKSRPSGKNSVVGTPRLASSAGSRLAVEITFVHTDVGTGGREEKLQLCDYFKLKSVPEGYLITGIEKSKDPVDLSPPPPKAPVAATEKDTVIKIVKDLMEASVNGTVDDEMALYASDIDQYYDDYEPLTGAVKANKEKYRTIYRVKSYRYSVQEPVPYGNEWEVRFLLTPQTVKIADGSLSNKPQTIVLRLKREKGRLKIGKHYNVP